MRHREALAFLLILAFLCFTGTGVSEATEPTQQSVSRAVSAQQRFAFHFYNELAKQNQGKNLFVSPPSIFLALAMVTEGAAGSTEQVMRKALDIEALPLGEWDSANQQLLRMLTDSADPKVEVVIADGLWGNKGVVFRPEFLKKNQELYQAEIGTLDFRKPEAVQTINTWVSQKTRGKIPDLLGSDSIDPAAILLLVNAIYFKGRWQKEFDKGKTFDLPFARSDGTQKICPFMIKLDDVSYLEQPGFQAVALPYGEGRWSMFLFLPEKNSNLEAFHQTLTPENWQRWMSSFSKQEVDIRIPRFKLQFECFLRDLLTALGMGEIFTSQADFSRIRENLGAFIDEGIHKAVIEVNEEGTEAAAATAMIWLSRATYFQADRPFFFAIRNNPTGELLFIGSVVDPSQ